MNLKDEILDRIAEAHNIAQFVSFDPTLRQRFCRIAGVELNHRFSSHKEAVATLLKSSPDGAVNIRTFRPEDPKGSIFHMGIRDVRGACQELERVTSNGLFAIVNELIDVTDGGVSGVAFGGVAEFAPNDTPRCVERKQVAALPTENAWRLFRTLYGVSDKYQFRDSERVEFSAHPYKRGFAREHLVIWQIDTSEGFELKLDIDWPNAFSTFIGDKTYGLLLADTFGFNVPRTEVLARYVPPFAFGQPTGAAIPWIRTSPRVKVPGKFSTHRGWKDPFALLCSEDPSLEHPVLMSVLVQDEVQATYSGATITGADGSTIIDATKGFGDGLMLGAVQPTKNIPTTVRTSVLDVHCRVAKLFGSVRLEWAYDAKQIWILQLQKEQALSFEDTIVPGEPVQYYDFDVTLGLEALRSVIAKRVGEGGGINLVGDIGMTSHMADVLRESKIPSKRVRSQRSIFGQ